MLVHNNIVYGGLCNFLYKNGLYKFFVMSLDFAEIKNIENMSMGMIYRMYRALQLLFVLFISDETIYQNTSRCLIIDVDGCFYIFCIK